MWTERLILLGVLIVVGGCAPQPYPTPTATKTPDPIYMQLGGATATATPEASEAQAVGMSAVPMPTPSASVVPPTPVEGLPTEAGGETPSPSPSVPPPTPGGNLPADHYWMQRPIPTGWTDYLDRTYAYGSTAGGKYRPHTGVEFWNPVGTPVVAVGNGTVAYAGTDWEELFGPQPSFYGNLIVLELSDYSYKGQPVYALYGHLSEMYVETGQAVPVGEIIGAVGGTGVANGGPHLHFEVRVGDFRSYFSTRNPDLWIKPYYGYGTLAGRVIDSNGAMLRNVALTVKGGGATRYTWTYAGEENNPDDEWGENFTLGDLPEGWYTVTTRSDKRSYSVEVYITAGRTSWLELIFD